jgi:hypothetical protein
MDRSSGIAQRGTGVPKTLARDTVVEQGAATETTRLLTGTDRTPDNDDDDDGKRSNAWNGLADFKGLPWWRMPSVGFTQSCDTPARI